MSLSPAFASAGARSARMVRPRRTPPEVSRSPLTEFLHEAWYGWACLWPYLVTALVLAIALAASGHAILYKRDVRSAVAWAGFIWLVPLLGAVLYVMFGVNRIRRRGRDETNPNPQCKAREPAWGELLSPWP